MPYLAAVWDMSKIEAQERSSLNTGVVRVESLIKRIWQIPLQCLDQSQRRNWSFDTSRDRKSRKVIPPIIVFRVIAG